MARDRGIYNHKTCSDKWNMNFQTTQDQDNAPQPSL
jgi:hypothetical protein